MLKLSKEYSQAEMWADGGELICGSLGLLKLLNRWAIAKVGS
jgi:hypothetical protein